MIFATVAVTGAAAQTIVQGRVSDSAGSPLAGVNVVENGTLNGTSTDSNGEYRLVLQAPRGELVFSYVGYRKRAIAFTQSADVQVIDVVLEEGLVLADMVEVVGSRNLNRSATETPVAIDVLDLEEVAARSGQLDIHQILQFAAPSFNANRQSGADGSDHIDPASLRGLGPDQTLVLINGKRRHQSSLINIFGSRGRGNTGTDLNAIPVSAIERIEILRDGASAQYGSDAIAGVINIVLKSSTGGLTGGVAAGANRAKFRDDRDLDGESVQLSGNYGVPIGAGGFLNLTSEYLSKGRTNRPADPSKVSIYRRQFGDAELENFAGFFNAGIPLTETASFYAFGGFNYGDTDAFAWTREPDSDRNVPAIYPHGFDPHILSTITDRSFSAGVRSRLRRWDVDLNTTYGANHFHYFVDGTLNASLLEKSPTRFDAGGFQLTQTTTGLGFSRFFSRAPSGLNVAFGAEYRVENYRIFAGEEASWKNYGIVDTVIDGRVHTIDVLGRPGGSQGFPGFRPDNETDEFRSNLGAYVDTELYLGERAMLAAAARFEHYSDFGRTLTAKLSSRLELTDGIALRGSVSTGFRAPSLAQVYFNSTFTDFIGGVATDKLIARNNSPITRALGIPRLKEETARSASVGLTARLLEGLTATVDAYLVDIEDRIVLTGDFGDDDEEIGADLQALNVSAAQFFTNAIDTRTWGLDVVLTYAGHIGPNGYRVSLAGNFNDMELGDIHTTARLAEKEDLYFGNREQHFLLASSPPRKLNLTFDYDRGRLHATVRFVRFGEIVLIDWVDTKDVYEPRTTTDVTLAYDVTPRATLIVGSSNVFNVYPSSQDTETETGGLWDAVQMGFSGSFYFGKLQFRMD